MNAHDSILAPDLDEARRFLEALAPKAERFTFQVFDDNADRKDDDLARTMHGSLGEAADRLKYFQSRGTGVWVTINETDFKRRKTENIVRVRACFVDLDGAPLRPVLDWEPPHILTETSPDRWHAYWVVDGLDRDEFTPMQKALIARFDADKSIHDLPRVMRLPGFWHQKVDSKKGLTGTPFMVRMKETSAFPVSFSAAEWRAKIAGLTPPPGDFLDFNTAPRSELRIDTGERHRSVDDYAEILRRARTDGEKHTGVRDLAAHLAGSGVARKMAEAIIRDACPVWDAGVERLIDSAYTKFSPGLSSVSSNADQVWPDPDLRFLRPNLPPAPPLPLEDILAAPLAKWVRAAAESKGAPTDYIFAALLSVAGAATGNSRWAAPWHGWAEPPVIWTMCVGLPSAGKSPAIDASVAPLRKAEKPLREKAAEDYAAWQEKAEIAKLAEATWKEAVKAALKAGDEPPARPPHAVVDEPPHRPRLVINDGTIEKIGAILSRQPRGILQMRDELAGWLQGMTRYSGGGSDRAFWLEAFGGRAFAVERMGRDPVTIDRLSVGVLGGIQPDKLRELMFKVADDGLLARFLPVWPDPAPLKRPTAIVDDALVERAVVRLLNLRMIEEEDGARPWFIGFTDDARDGMDRLREKVRAWEAETAGLMLSFIGKLPGLAARIALVLAHLDYAVDDGEQFPHDYNLARAEEPREITAEHFRRAATLIETYVVPMARRAYAAGSVPKEERAATRLLALILEQGWTEFHSRDVLRLDRSGLTSATDLNPALDALEEGDVIRPAQPATGQKGGRPRRVYRVNPKILREVGK